MDFKDVTEEDIKRLYESKFYQKQRFQYFSSKWPGNINLVFVLFSEILLKNSTGLQNVFHKQLFWVTPEIINFLPRLKNNVHFTSSQLYIQSCCHHFIITFAGVGHLDLNPYYRLGRSCMKVIAKHTDIFNINRSLMVPRLLFPLDPWSCALHWINWKRTNGRTSKESWSQFAILLGS